MTAPVARIDLDAWRASLHATGAFDPPAWLTDALGDPAAFWRTAGPAMSRAVGGGSRSTLFERYQLAHDLAARHTANRALGFVDHSAAGWTATSYTRIVEAASGLAGAWRARGVAAGSCVAIVAPVSLELVVALIAAWQLGAIAAPLPMWGRTYVIDRLTACAGEFVATSRACARWLALEPTQHLPLRAIDGTPSAATAHPYAPDEPALRVCSPLGDAPLSAIDVPAERLYLGALRDGVMFFALGAGLGLAAPGFCEVQLGIPMITACLATGAYFVALDLDTACQQPSLLAGDRIHVLGVHPRLRDALLAGDAAELGRGPVRWFRSAGTAHEPEAWTRLAALRPFARALGACYVASPVTGGAITWSAWRQTPALNAALPAPGLDWQIIDPGQRGGAPAVDGNGILTMSTAPPELLGKPLLGRIAGESLWIASLGAHRDGQRLPAGEIEALARSRPDVWAAGLIDDPRIGGVLVVFADPGRLAAAGAPNRDTIGRELGELIGRELAPHLVPARIVVLSVPPRFTDDGALDVAWCGGQYTSGRFATKQREPLFTTLARLRRALDP